MIIDNSLASLLIAIVFFIIGAAVIGLVWYFQGVMRKGQAKPADTLTIDADQTEIARLIRDNRTQDLVVGMDGTVYKNFHELSLVLQRRLSFTSNVLVKWLAAPAPQPAPEEETPAQPAEANPFEPQSQPGEAASPDTHPEWVPPFATDTISEVTPVSTDIPDVVGGIINPAPKPAPEFKSIAMQINDILQVQLAGTALESRGITVNDAPDHGVMVTLDGQKYMGIKDVPDEEVRKAIRAAVMEWETRK